MTTLRGDFFAQNSNALQPGPVAPWSIPLSLHLSLRVSLCLFLCVSLLLLSLRYARYGHSLDAITVELVIENRIQEVELMVLMGGFAPGAINDIWVTEDGETWL
jgi:hypothetical protein